MPGWHFNTVVAGWIGISSVHEISVFLWKKNTTILPKDHGDCEVWWFQLWSETECLWQNWSSCPFILSVPKSWDKKNYELRIRSCNLQITYNPDFSQGYMLQCPIFWKSWELGVDMWRQYVLYTDKHWFTKIVLFLIESRGCEITFCSRTWGSKHWLIVEQLYLALSQSRNNVRIWKWMGETVINLALK